MADILLAEDNLADVLLVRQALETHHVEHELHVVRDGDEALEYIALMDQPGGTPCPVLLMLDLNLPKIEGSRVLVEFRKHPRCAHTPVIVVSSSNVRRDREELAALGVDRYFTKPSDLDEFLQLGAVVEEVIREAQDRGHVV